MNTDIVYKYIGRGAFVVADVPVPARDIAEWEIMQSPELKAAIELNMANAPGTCYERAEPVVLTKKVAKAAVVETVTEPTTGKAE